MVNAVSSNPIRFRGPSDKETPLSSGAGQATAAQKSGAMQKPQSSQDQASKGKESVNLDGFFAQLRTKVEDFLHSLGTWLQDLSDQLGALAKRLMKPKSDAESSPSTDAEPVSTPSP